MGKTIWIYARYSSEMQRENTSEARQRDNALEAGKKFVQHTKEFADYQLNEDVFFDKAVSAKAGKNLLDEDSQWPRLMKVVKPNDLVLCESQDRFSRLPSHRAMCLLEDLLIAKKFKVIFLDNPGLILTKDNFSHGFNDLGTYIKGKMNNDYIVKLGKSISESYKVRKKELVESGKAYNTRPCGWLTWDPKIKGYILNDRAKSIPYVFELATRGYGLRAIVAKLNKEQIPLAVNTPKRFKQEWKASSVHRLLTEKTVIGYNQYVSPPLRMYPCVVSDEVWYKVNAKIDERRSRKFYGPIGGARNLFQGVARCTCGKSMTIVPSKAKLKDHNDYSYYYYYRCGNGAYGECTTKLLSHIQVEQSFLQFVSLPNSSSAAMFRNTFAENKRNLGEEKPTYELISAKLVDIKETLQKTLDDYEANPSRILAKMMADLERQETELQAELESNRLKEAGQVELAEVDLELRNKFLEEWELRNHEEEFRMEVRELIRSLISKIEMNVREKTYTIHFKDESLKPVTVTLYRHACRIDNGEVIRYDKKRTDFKELGIPTKEERERTCNEKEPVC